MAGDRLDIGVQHTVTVVAEPVLLQAHVHLPRYLVHQRHPVRIPNHIVHKHKRRVVAHRLLDGIDAALFEKVDPIADNSDRVPGLEVQRLLAEGAEGVVGEGDVSDGGVDGAVLG